MRAALRFLRDRLGSWKALAKAMGIKQHTLELAAKRRGRRPSAGHALRVARVARVRVETILAGKWPTSLTPRRHGRFHGFGRK